MTDILYRRLDAWPQRDTAERKSRYQFKSSYPDILKHIEDELRRIDATDVVLEGLIVAKDTRRDGWPLSGAVPTHPGLRLSWQSKTHGPGELMTDEYQTWQANLRAIGLTLEALRAVGRYGAMARKQQYKGLLAAQSPTEPPPAKAVPDVAAAAALIATFAKADSNAAARMVQAELPADYFYRTAVKLVHPDQGGDAGKFRQLQDAKAVLDAHHKGRR